MQYEKRSKQEIILFNGKYNITVRNSPHPKKSKKNQLQPSIQPQSTNSPSIDSTPNQLEAVRTSIDKNTHNISIYAHSSGAQTEASMSQLEDEQWRKVPTKQKPKPRSKPQKSSMKDLSLQEIRDLLSKLYDIRWSKSQILRFSSINTRKTINNDLFNLTTEIQLLQKESRLREIQWIQENPDFINIHNGYRREEIDEMLSLIALTLQNQYKKGKSRIIPEKRNRKWVTCLKILTGRGLHSPENTSVLKEQIKQWTKNKQGFSCIPYDDHILLYIPLTH